MQAIKAYQERLASKFSAFGKNIPQIYTAIANQQWKGERPIGPIGTYVELVERKWIEVVKIAIGHHMSSWIITDADDFKPMKKILEDTGKCVPLFQLDIFDNPHTILQPPNQHHSLEQRSVRLQSRRAACGIYDCPSCSQCKLERDLTFWEVDRSLTG